MTVLKVQAQTQSGAAFLRFGPDATSAALGGAVVSVADGASAMYWNPAGLARPIGQEALVAQQNWTGGTVTYSGAARFNAGSKAGLGALVTATTSGEMDYREGPGDPLGVFSAQFGSINVGYGRAFSKHLRFGAAAKLVNERLDSYSSRGVAADAGLQGEWKDGQVRFGLAARHFGAMNNSDSVLPRTVQGGITVFPFQILSAGDQQILLTTRVSVEATRLVPDEETQISVGVASKIFDMVTVRGGYLSNDAIRKWSFGAGMQVASLTLDVAYLPFSAGYNDGYLLTLRYWW